MSKAALILAGLAVVGGGLYAASKAHAESGGGAAPGSGSAPVETVVGDSGTTYQVQMVGAQDDPGGGGRKLTFDVFDVAGLILRYMQWQGDNTSRILVLTPDAPHTPGDPMWLNAVQDFGIFTSVPGLA